MYWHWHCLRCFQHTLSRWAGYINQLLKDKQYNFNYYYLMWTLNCLLGVKVSKCLNHVILQICNKQINCTLEGSLIMYD